MINLRTRWLRCLCMGGLIVACATASACAAPAGMALPQDEPDAVEKLKAELEAAQAALKESKKALAKYAAAQAKEAAAEETAEQFREDLKELKEELANATKKWRSDLAAAKTNAEKSTLFRNRPEAKLGDEFLSLYEDYEGVDGASEALRQALMLGGRPTKAKAAKYLAGLAGKQDAATRKGTFVLLAQFGSGPSREKGLAGLMELARKGNDESLLTQIVAAPGREGESIRKQAAGMLWAQAKKDLKSIKAPRMLTLVGQHGDAKIASQAYEALLEHHPDSKELTQLLSNPARMPSRATEMLLRMAMKNGGPEQQIQAALSYVGYSETREMYKNFYADATDEQIEAIGRDTYEYLKEDLEPIDIKDIERRLDSYVKSSEGLLNKAKDQLFAIKNLMPGATAMEISGVDLDGVEFKLSDYRGKVVFLDFWGDW